ncbi:MAG: hypothetical protein C6P37_01870 [Caldibacillus debilis]|uniref:Uncharacterized protein n=1 Tax=Caldibacillus debilis TaxID=301148 RepID=A0A3E0K8Q7_9BACI|nr:hypothetical protein [Caldibacillus debilis]REJ31106.1 MAG: hypothetical protein C6P37_01870 [Caldibacillus debilis]
MSYLHAIMYKIADDEAFSRFIDEHRLTDQIVTKTNVLQNTEYYQKILNIILYIHLAAGHDNQISALFGSRKKINSANTAKKSTGTLFNEKKPGYLSLTGNLGVSKQESMEGLIIWPLLIGGYAYGFMVQKDGEVYEINLDEELNPIDQGDETAARLWRNMGVSSKRCIPRRRKFGM